jgi:outer membrane lipoprotein-sorting protein
MRRRLRFIAPVAVAAAIGLGAWIPTLPAAASPNLPSLSVNQLIAMAEQPSVSGFTGSVDWTANLGLPSLSSLTGGAGESSGFTWTDLLSGSHQIKVWDGGAGGQRLALIGSASETDLYSSGGQSWLYDSASNTATHLLPAAGKGEPAGSAPSASGTTAASDQAGSHVALTPQQVSAEILRQVDSVTAISVSRPLYVAGQAAYVVTLEPKAAAPGASVSTVGNIAIAIDAANGSPLRVSVTPRGSHAPALSVGFSTVRFEAAGHQLPASEFRFSPPPGATVKTQSVGGGLHAGSAQSSGLASPTIVGSGWGTVAILHGAGNALTASAPTGPVVKRQGSHRLVGRLRGSAHASASAGQELAAVTTAVPGPSGTSRLLSTSMINVLILPNGDVAAGFVTPPALEAAASGAG